MNPFGFSCFHCGVYVTGRNPHAEHCPTRAFVAVPMTPGQGPLPPEPRCECGSPEAHFQFCPRYRPYRAEP